MMMVGWLARNSSVILCSYTKSRRAIINKVSIFEEDGMKHMSENRRRKNEKKKKCITYSLL